jgi:hypothetical protein
MIVVDSLVNSVVVSTMLSEQKAHYYIDTVLFVLTNRVSYGNIYSRNKTSICEFGLVRMTLSDQEGSPVEHYPEFAPISVSF